MMFQKLFEQALQCHQAGQISHAVAGYRMALQFNSRSPETHFNLGLAFRQQGRPDEAMVSLQNAVRIKPDYADAYNTIGNILKDQKDLQKAAGYYRKAIASAPTRFEAHTNLADTLREQGQFEDAITPYVETLRLKPDQFDVLGRLGIALQKLGRTDEAISCLCTAIEHVPDTPELLFHLAFALQEKGQLSEATSCYRAALELKPDLAAAWLNQSELLRRQGFLDEALESARKGVSLRPGSAEYHNAFAIALHATGHVEQAIVSYRKALELDPQLYQALGNLGSALRQVGKLDDAIVSHRAALAINSDDPEVHWNYAMALLARGDFIEGWQEFEWRWKTGQLKQNYRELPRPQWKGEPAEGKTLLIHAEQGFGDTLQFCRYAKLAAARNLRVIMLVPQALLRLFGSLKGVSGVYAVGTDVPLFDLHCPIMSLPFALKTTLDTIPADGAYLHADATQTTMWKDYLAAAVPSGLRVGMVWAGNPRPHSPDAAAVDKRRSIAVERMEPIFKVPGIHFFSLQKTGAAAPPAFKLIDFMDQMNDFADTAALIMNLDLVISVDTAVAHLAAALGKPVWILDRFDACWRWLTDRRDSPWYPSVRLYRQPEPSDWDAVIAEVVQDLHAYPKPAS
ncbi:MAG TPA: tetratricopeptide repeat protein [Rhodopila sp.]|nr:tetratricopeptide repeat protein [Rhodopila sp.]